MLELALIENVQRHDQNAIERGLGLKALMETLGLTQEAVAAKVGLRRSSVANHVRLLELPQPVQDAIAKGLVTMGHARALLGMEDSAGMLDLLEQTVRQELSVRDVERLVRAGSKTAAPTVPSAAVESAVPPAWLAVVETRLRSLGDQGVGSSIRELPRHGLDRVLLAHRPDRLLDHIALPTLRRAQAGRAARP